MSGGWLTVGVVGDNSTSGLWATGFLLQGGRSKKERKKKQERKREGKRKGWDTVMKEIGVNTMLKDPFSPQ